MSSCPDQYRCLKRASWTIGWCFLVFVFVHEQSKEIKGSSCHFFLTFVSWLLSAKIYSLILESECACLVKNRRSVESWASLSLSFAHYLEDHFSHATEKTSLICLLFFVSIERLVWVFIYCLFISFWFSSLSPSWCRSFLKSEQRFSFKSIFVFESIENQLLKLLKKKQ